MAGRAPSVEVQNIPPRSADLRGRRSPLIALILQAVSALLCAFSPQLPPHYHSTTSKPAAEVSYNNLAYRSVPSHMPAHNGVLALALCTQWHWHEFLSLLLLLFIGGSQRRTEVQERSRCVTTHHSPHPFFHTAQRFLRGSSCLIANIGVCAVHSDARRPMPFGKTKERFTQHLWQGLDKVEQLPPGAAVHRYIVIAMA